MCTAPYDVHLEAAADMDPDTNDHAKDCAKTFWCCTRSSVLLLLHTFVVAQAPAQHPQSLTGMAYTWKEPQTWMTTMMLAMHTTQMGPLREYRIWSPAELPKAA